MEVQCGLCPKQCIIGPGQSGDCKIRVNIGGRLLAVSYGHPCAVHVDPIEKKPLFHFLPGSKALSIATVGCNLHCQNCQNWEISQALPEETLTDTLTPEELGLLAKATESESVAYTYTEPLAYYEYTLDCCQVMRDQGYRNILVTAGYINERPLRKLCNYVDAANIDLKALSDQFYRDVCRATLRPVLETLVTAKSMGVHVEVTNLVIPTLNDTEGDLRRLSRWIVENLGCETPVHFSRFYPQYRMQHLPPTPAETLIRAQQIGRSEGLRHVYIGNLVHQGGEDTLCERCESVLIRRSVYTILENRLQSGCCPECGAPVYGVWN